MHDRADYKTGWAMEQEFEAKEKKRKEREALGEWAEEEDEEEYLVGEGEWGGVEWDGVAAWCEAACFLLVLFLSKWSRISRHSSLEPDGRRVMLVLFGAPVVPRRPPYPPQASPEWWIALSASNTALVFACLCAGGTFLFR